MKSLKGNILTHIVRAAFAAAALVLAAGTSFAAKVVTVKGESTYYDDGTHSRIECMRLAAEQARIDALAKEFGTTVAQDIVQTDRISGNREHNDFLSLSTTEVRGVWIGDIGEPEYEISNDADGNFVVSCRIKGSASPISNEASEFQSSVLRNTPDIVGADNHFRDGDTMYLYYNGSDNGYLSVFLEDEQNNVMQLLPYTSDSDGRLEVRKNKEYIFFSPKHNQDKSVAVDELTLTAPERTEYNRVYVVFSPSEFARPVMTGEPGGLPVMRSSDFTKWLTKARRNDSKMGVKTMNIEISPRNI